ncbi:hypothetical protein QR77_18850 [Streptomyces sp. 150FB]|nr:hypothetical protein QR77_18850 [Streptomyces sp. 150FB]
MGRRLRDARARGFVGRGPERDLFRSALAGTPDAFAVLYLHGPGGIGKSTLLRRFADDAEAARRPVVRVDGRTAGRSARQFWAAAGRSVDTPGAVLLVDGFERCDAVAEWFRQDFLPRLPSDGVVVVASRRAPEPGWRTDLGWGKEVRTVGLRNLSPEDAVALLDGRGVPTGMRRALLAFTGGHPLALSLAAEVAAGSGSGTADDAPRAEPGGAGPGPAERWSPGQDVIEHLLAQLVGTLPSGLHRRVLEVCAHAHNTTEELLRAVLPSDTDAGGLFGWLRSLPYVETGPEGLYPHDIVRAALDADLRWRDPEGYEAVHLAVRDHLLDRARTAEGTALLHLMEALIFVHRHTEGMTGFFTWRTEPDLWEDACHTEDRAAVVALAAETEGAESARIVEFWLDRQPEAFHVYRRTRPDDPTGQGPGVAEPVAFMAWLRLPAVTDAVTEAERREETAADPVVAAAWAHARSAAPVRAGEHVALARFLVDPAAYQRPSPVTDLVQMRVLSEWLRAVRPAWSYLVVADPEFWGPQMAYLEQRRVPADPSVGGRTYALFGHDWRAAPAGPWFDGYVARELYGPRSGDGPTAGGEEDPSDLAVLSREEFGDAVRAVLRAWRRPDVIAASPLLRSRLVTDRMRGGERPGPGGPADGPLAGALREAVVDAVDALGRDPRAEPLHRAVTTAYFRGVPTREAAAERLGVPLSTFRRHVARAVDRVIGYLWQQELSGPGSQ